MSLRRIHKFFGEEINLTVESQKGNGKDLQLFLLFGREVAKQDINLLKLTIQWLLP